jgi:hypothetical protein
MANSNKFQGITAIVKLGGLLINIIWGFFIEDDLELAVYIILLITHSFMAFYNWELTQILWFLLVPMFPLFAFLFIVGF